MLGLGRWIFCRRRWQEEQLSDKTMVRRDGKVTRLERANGIGVDLTDGR